MKKILALCHVHIKICVAIVIKTSHEHANVVDNLPLASRRAVHPAVSAHPRDASTLRWLKASTSSACFLLQAHLQASALVLANILVAAYCILQKGQLLLIPRQPLHLSFSHPPADFTAILELLRPGWEALSAVQIACEILLGQEAEAKGASQNDTSQNEHTESQYTGKGPAAAGHSSWKESSLGHWKVPHTHCWFSQIRSAGSAPAVCCFRKRSTRNICWISTFSFSDALLHSL